MMGPCKKRGLFLTLLSLGSFAGMGAVEAAPPQANPPAPPNSAWTANARTATPDTLRLTRNIPGDSKPIILDADHITTWVEGRQQVILLEGQVMIEQGVVHARMQRAVAWVDLDRSQRTRILHMDIYAEGDVHLENATESNSGPAAFLDLNTRGECRMHAYKDKAQMQPKQQDPAYQRAMAARSAQPVTPAASPILRTSATSTDNRPPAPR